MGEELTTTLHLSTRTQGDLSRGDLSQIDSIAGIIEESTPEEREILNQIMSGDGESAMVLIHRGPSRGARFLITSKGATIGRAPANEIFLDDVTVSRSHASITRNDGKFIFTDAGSLNGSYVNNQQSTNHSLSTGDEIQIGKFHLLFIGAAPQSGEK